MTLLLEWHKKCKMQCLYSSFDVKNKKVNHKNPLCIYSFIAVFVDINYEINKAHTKLNLISVYFMTKFNDVSNLKP